MQRGNELTMEFRYLNTDRKRYWRIGLKMTDGDCSRKNQIRLHEGLGLITGGAALYKCTTIEISTRCQPKEQRLYGI